MADRIKVKVCPTCNSSSEGESIVLAECDRCETLICGECQVLIAADVLVCDHCEDYFKNHF